MAQAKKRRKVRKKKRSIADELQPLEDAGADDRGSRKDAAKARRERQEDEARDDKRQRGYDAAMDKAMASSRFSSEMDGLSWDPEEREAEAQSLARARQLTSKAESGLAIGLDAVKEQEARLAARLAATHGSAQRWLQQMLMRQESGWLKALFSAWATRGKQVPGHETGL